MKNRGVSLIELLIVIAVISILITALGFSFQGWMGNYKVESQTKQLYADIMDAKARAMTNYKMHFIVLNTNSYQIFVDEDNDNNAESTGSPPDDAPVAGFTNPKSVEYSLGWTGTIGFDTRGLAWEYTNATTRVEASRTIAITHSTDVTPDYDCVRVTILRVQTGKMSGANCDVK